MDALMKAMRRPWPVGERLSQWCVRPPNAWAGRRSPSPDRSLDLGLEIGQPGREQGPEKGKRQQRETAVAILNVGGGDDAVQQQTLRIDQNMPLLALDQLAGIEAVAVDASPPFSALFTL